MLHPSPDGMKGYRLRAQHRGSWAVAGSNAQGLLRGGHGFGVCGKGGRLVLGGAAAQYGEPFQEGVQVSSSQGWGRICGESHTAGPGSKAYFSLVETPAFAGKG